MSTLEPAAQSKPPGGFKLWLSQLQMKHGRKLVIALPYIWLILLALVPQLFGHSSFNWALGYLSAAFVSITLLGEPIGSAVLAYILLEETPTLLKIFGAILILAGIYIASRSETKSQEIEGEETLAD